MPPAEPAVDLAEQILRHAHGSPERLALRDATRALTYVELRDEVLAIGARLCEAGVRPRDRVGLHLGNSADFVTAALACLAVGAVFVPLATSDPPARLSLVTEDAEPRLVVSRDGPPRPTTGPGEVGPFAGCEVVTPEELRRPVRAAAERDLRADRWAYVLYTSGTTGRPKGVLVCQDAVAAAVRAAVAGFGLHEGTVGMCFSPFHFDGSFGTLFPVLVAGGTLLVPPRETLLVPRLFVETLCAEGVTHVAFSPSYLRLLLESPELVRLATSRLVTLGLGGEACSIEDLRRLRAAAPSLRVFNRYGPTETTIAVTTHEITDEVLSRRDAVPIGRPHPGVRFAVVDEEGRTVTEAGASGELWIAGDHLMAGYWGDEALSAEVLRVDPESGTRWYRTGDLVAIDEAGEPVFVDRQDHVVNRNGVRIALSEVDAALRRLPPVRDACSVASTRGREVEIGACVVAPGTSPPELRRALGAQLPGTMLPDHVRLLDALPLTPAGKVDVAAVRRLVWPVP